RPRRVVVRPVVPVRRARARIEDRDRVLRQALAQLRVDSPRADQRRRDAALLLQPRLSTGAKLLARPRPGGVAAFGALRAERPDDALHDRLRVALDTGVDR